MKIRFLSVISGMCVMFFPNAHAAEPLPTKINNNFAIGLYQTLSAESTDKNLFISPYGIYSALSMAYAGSGGSTKAEFEKSLGIKDRTTFHATLSKTIASLNERQGKGFSISTANALWIDRTAKILNNYKELTKKYYGVSEYTLDATKPKDSADKINGWVQEKTKNKIPELITPDNITPDTKLVLANAVYFQGEWLNTFKPHYTREGNFNSFSSTPVKAQMMHQQNHFKLMAVNNSRFIELPYKENQLSMIIILPKEKGAAALKDAEKNLSSNLEKFLAANKSAEVVLTLPKFKIETPLVVLNEPLQKLGIKDAFIYPKADFSGITGNRNLFIGLVAHKAMISVNERGTEAAAPTAVKLAGGVTMSPNRPKKFTADRPFLYLIRDNQTGLVLFIGKLLDPTAL